MATIPLSDYEAVVQTIGGYIEAARTGDAGPMRAVFHPDAWIFGWFDGEPFNGPIQKLFDWDDANGPAPDIRTQITHVDLAETVAVVRLEIENWTGHRFTDFFTLLKIDDSWKIMNKVFHKHAVPPPVSS
jgi:hypothetical protein